MEQKNNHIKIDGLTELYKRLFRMQFRYENAKDIQGNKIPKIIFKKMKELEKNVTDEIEKTLDLLRKETKEEFIKEDINKEVVKRCVECRKCYPIDSKGNIIDIEDMDGKDLAEKAENYEKLSEKSLCPHKKEKYMLIICPDFEPL